jgi:hypothetical protein
MVQGWRVKTWPALLLSIVATTANATDSFRCGNDLVASGDPRSKVLARCGQPSDVTQASAWRAPVLWYAGRRAVYGSGLIEIPVEIWVYNTGPGNLMRELRFESGALVSVKVLGYGYYER